MKGSRRLRLGMWLERFRWLHPWLLVLDGEGDDWCRYVNRINGHLVMKPEVPHG